MRGFFAALRMTIFWVLRGCTFPPNGFASFRALVHHYVRPFSGSIHAVQAFA
jgi:hypothetical protein